MPLTPRVPHVHGSPVPAVPSLVAAWWRRALVPAGGRAAARSGTGMVLAASPLQSCLHSLLALLGCTSLLLSLYYCIAPRLEGRPAARDVSAATPEREQGSSPSCCQNLPPAAAAAR